MSAAEEIRRAIDDAGGAVPFETFMHLALYGEHGFYTGGRRPGDGLQGGQAGRRGDFLTGPEVGPLFGAVVARLLDAEWNRLGRPDPFTVVEAGAGAGTLARTVAAAKPTCWAAVRYVAVEVSAAQRTRHPDHVEPRGDLPSGPLDGVVLANELLDNLPFRLVVFDGAWREAYVATAGDGTFVEVLSAPLDPVPNGLGHQAALGARAPLQRGAADWVRRAQGLLRRGRVVAVDYAVATTAELVNRPWREWLRTYRRHERGGHYLTMPGEQDMTSDVAIDQLLRPDSVTTQAAFLRRWGIDELVTEGQRAWSAAAAHPDLTAMAMRSRVSEAEALLDPAGLGGFSVLEWAVGETSPEQLDTGG